MENSGRIRSLRIEVEDVELIEENDTDSNADNETDDESINQEISTPSLQLVVEYSDDDSDSNSIEDQLNWIQWPIFNRSDLDFSREEIQCIVKSNRFAMVNSSIIIRGFVGIIPLNNDLNRTTFYLRHFETIYTISMHRITLVVILKYIISRKLNINVENIFLNVNGRLLIDSQTLMNANIHLNLIDWNLSHYD